MTRRSPRAVLAALLLLLLPTAAWTQPVRGRVSPGITVLVTDSIHLLRGKRVGLITNHTGRDAAGVSSIDLLARAPGVRLTALFGPEHGLRGLAQAGEKVASSVDSATGVTVFSLYGSTRVPTPEMLKTIDILVYDIQDVGARTYTYPWTMALSAEAAGKAGIPFIVCDRPVPIRGDVVGGGVLDTAYRSFVGQYPVAMRYGLTPGELMGHLVRTRQVQARVVVVPMRGWTRSMWYEETGLPWIAPSPNLKTVDAALLYTGTVLVEGTNLSEGRGTDAPFQLVGAPWLTDAAEIAATLDTVFKVPGVRFEAVTRTIAAGQKHGGLTIPMIRITVSNRDSVVPSVVATLMLGLIQRKHPREFVATAFMDKLAGDDGLRRALTAGSMVAGIVERTEWRMSAATFAERSKPDRLY